MVTTVQSLQFNNKYRRLFSPTDFDLLISDEAHRSIGGNSRAVFEYFIGYKLGLTATPKDYLKKIDRKSRTHDQMVQAARSGVQNIAEGSQASGTSKKMELKLTNVARASLEELRRDYEDFLRHRALPFWDWNDPCRADLIDRRPANADAVAAWAKDVKNGQHGRHGQAGASTSSMQSISYPEIAANGALALIAVACSLLDRQLAAQAAAFEKEGGFTERLFRVRSQNRKSTPPNKFMKSITD